MCETMGVSQRRTCQVLGQPRSNQRHVRKVPEDEEPLVERIVSLVSQYGRYGYRRITAVLRNEGWKVNHKRVERIWRQEGVFGEFPPSGKKMEATAMIIVRLEDGKMV